MLFVLAMNLNLILIHTSGVINNNVHYIIPSPNVPCPEESCLTLSTLAANGSYNDMDTTIIFLDGNHTLDSGLTISNIHHSLTLLTNGTVAISCSDGAYLDFYDITQLQINGIEFIGCSCNIELVGQLTLENCRFYGESNYSALELFQTNTSIVQSSFVSNTAGTYQSDMGVLAYMRNNSYNFLRGYRTNISSTSAEVGGALIVTNSTVNISNSNFENNSAKVGGAIFIELGSYLSICNCTFVSNSATGCYSSPYNYSYYYYYIDGSCLGGALFVDNGCSVIAHNSTFIDNSAGYSGGAIALFQDSEVFLGGSQNVFSGNRGGTLGGAISAFDRSRITIDSSCYSNNTGRYGGVIYMDGHASITVSNCSFDDNEASYDGGVIFAYYGSNFTVGDSSFENNEAGSSGGVIFAYYGSNFTVGDSSFENNEAGSSGGVIFALYSSSITVDNSLFNNNTAHFNAGVMDVFGNITVGNSSFENNEAGNIGGVMYAYSSSSITVGNSSFENNEAGSSGGVVYASSSSSITVGNSSFENNEAGSSGGVVYASSSSSITVGNSSFENNEAGSSGGVVYASSSSSITVGNSSFEKNEAGSSGGVVYASSSSSITVGNSSFENNEAGSSGGVVYASSSSSITMGNSSFENNEAGRSGGVVYASSSSSITMGNSSFENNEAGSSGGVVYASSSSSITMGNSSFENNEAGSSGGVVYASSNSSITVDNSLFNNNTAHIDAGVMDVSGSSSITVGNSLFNNNTAHIDAGVMDVSGSSSITVGNSLFNNNTAHIDAGVMYLSGSSSSSITVCNSYFDNNEAGNSGGVVYASGYSGSITVDNSLFNNNTAHFDAGVMYLSGSSSSSITVCNSYFDNNEAGRNGGVMFYYSNDNNSDVIMENTTFHGNAASYYGGVLYYHTIDSVQVSLCAFLYNSANEGGAVYVHNAMFTDLDSSYYGNMASSGGAIALLEGYVSVRASRFMKNTAKSSGGVLYSSLHDFVQVVDLESSCFINNSANSGGAIAAFSTARITVTESIFTYNNAVRGGAVYLLTRNNFTVNCSNFTHNLGQSDGGMIFSENQNKLNFIDSEVNYNRAGSNGGAVTLLFLSELNITGGNSFTGNQARSGGVAYTRESSINIQSQTLSMANNTAVETGGAVHLSAANLFFLEGYNKLVQNQAQRGAALYATNSVVEAFNDSLIMANNTARDTGGAVYLSKANLSIQCGFNEFSGNEAGTGGAVHLGESHLTISGDYVVLFNNEAGDGGAVFSSESKLVINSNGQTKIYANSAAHHGGGLYLTRSELRVSGESSNITRNTASNQGGGILVSNSSIIIEGTIHLVSNEAENGGGISLEKNAKLCGAMAGHTDIINFVNNRASHYGGALYINDETNPDICRAVSLQDATLSTACFLKSVYIKVTGNFANISGSNLFGGLLDRCTVYNEISMEYQTKYNEPGIINFLNSSNIDETQLFNTVTSHPVRLCFCRGNQPDCNYQPESIQANRGHTFSINLIAYNHIHYPVNASIQCSLNSSAGGLGEGEKFQNIKSACTELKYNLFTPYNYEELTFSAVRDPCNETSVRTVAIEIICSCPVGFQISSNNDTTCDCSCHQLLQSYQNTECNPTTESIIRRENFWISYINYTGSNYSSGYVIYSHCPFDYCYTPDKEVSVNLNLPNGSDAQCNSNRMGTLCGTCKSGLSVSLGSSICVRCPKYWPGLLVTIVIAFILLGIGLVAFLLLLNLTVAIGTLNALIFYANIVAANKSILFPSGVSFASVFVSWLNFDLGIDVCFFDRMDMYVKTWLQLAFPVYIIILVVVIVQLSYYFDAFGRYIGKKDPVATLATLILLSYTKLLQTIITAFSTATLAYPDGSKKILWLPDATIGFFTSKHAVLFFTAVLVLLAGLVYTVLLFSWQWFLYCPRKRVKWIINQKLSSFMEVYHIPYVPKHRYWTGLLLLARVGVYLVSAFNPSGDPRVTLLATTFVIICLIVYIATFSVRIYKNRYINIMETLTYFNIMALSIFSWYTVDADTNQTILTNMSVGVTFIQLAAIIVYHAYKHANQKMFTAIKRGAIYIKVKQTLKQMKKNAVSVNEKPPADEDIYRFHELLDIIGEPVTNDYNIPQVEQNAEPTQSVVELPKPVQASSTPSSHVTEEGPELQKPHQIENCSDTKPAKPVASEMAQSDDKDQSSQEGLKEGIGSYSITVKAEVHN